MPHLRSPFRSLRPPGSGRATPVEPLAGSLEPVALTGSMSPSLPGANSTADVRSGGIHGQMDLAPSAPPLNAVLAGWPLAIAIATRHRHSPLAGQPDPGAVHKQVEGAISAPKGDLDGQRFLPTAQGRTVRHGPIRASHLEQTGHRSRRRPERRLEQDLDRQAEPDRRIADRRRTARAAILRCEPAHLVAQPDQERPALAERRCAGSGPIDLLLAA